MDGFTALADPTRRRIIELLARGAMDAGALADHFPVSRPAISRHLRVLREGGLVIAQADAQRRVYSLRGEGLHDLQNWIGRQQAFWSERLDALEAALEED